MSGVIIPNLKGETEMQNLFEAVSKLTGIKKIELHPEWNTTETVIYPKAGISITSLIKELGLVFHDQVDKIKFTESGGLSFSTVIYEASGLEKVVDAKYPKAGATKLFFGDFGIVVVVAKAIDPQGNVTEHMGDIIIKWEEIPEQKPAKAEAKAEVKPAVKAEATEELKKRRITFGRKGGPTPAKKS